MPQSSTSQTPATWDGPAETTLETASALELAQTLLQSLGGSEGDQTLAKAVDRWILANS